ncbi:hypothetical protein [Candidatus Endolissoclinum faulkneri]|nr:hypothetical protein [Candidatus Endolissoclinum faulkneri]
MTIPFREAYEFLSIKIIALHCEAILENKLQIVRVTILAIVTHKVT